ncbi:hypothetical protein ACQKPX_09695 [Photobacterium sp. DNB23_23_1]
MLGHRVDDGRADLFRSGEVIMLNKETVMDDVADRTVSCMVVV